MKIMMFHERIPVLRNHVPFSHCQTTWALFRDLRDLRDSAFQYLEYSPFPFHGATGSFFLEEEI